MLIPPAYGLQGVGFETYTGDGPISYWNNYVAMAVLLDSGSLFASLNASESEQYSDAKLDFVDTLIVAIAERLNITRVLTLDRRDFGLIRPKHCGGFEILP